MGDFKMTAGGAWRRPRMKVYDYNQEFGGNYYQPMIQYINHKDIYGPFSKKADVYLPHSAEVTSAKYTNMRYNPIRLLKGAPPGQEAVNHYISELSIVKTGNHKLDTKYRKHLAMVEACEDEYDYHHKLFGQG